MQKHAAAGDCRRSGLLMLLAAAALSACTIEKAPAHPTLVLAHTVAGVNGDLMANRGLLDLLASRLRALRGMTLVRSADGCGHAGASHALRLVHEQTPHSDVIAIELRNCRTGLIRQEPFITRREAQRDASIQVAWWVAHQLQLAGAARPGKDAVGERAMTDWLTAIGHLQQRSREGIGSALRLLHSAIAAQPDFAAAHAELAIAELLASEYGLSDLASALARAEQAGTTALRLDPESGTAMASRGLAAMMVGRYREAVPLLQSAHRFEPGHDGIMLWLGNALLYSGRPREALPWLEAVAEINAGLMATRISIGEAHCIAGNEEPCRRFLSQSPASPMQDYVASLMRAHRGDLSDAIERLSRNPPAVAPDWIADTLGKACRAIGDKDCGDPIEPVDDAPLTEPDLWQLDLGWSNYMHRVGDPVIAGQLRDEVAQLTEGGVRLPVLDAVTACIEDDPEVRTSTMHADQLAALLGCE